MIDRKSQLYNRRMLIDNILPLTRRLGALESRMEHASQALQELQEVGSFRDETIKERLTGVEKSLREVHRCVQIIRDKQVCGGCF